MAINAPSVDIKDILIADEPLGSGGLVFGANLHVNVEPATPDIVITIYDTGGFSPDAGADYERPTVQIRSRGDQGGVVTAYDNLKTIANHLHSNASNLIMVNRIINAARYLAMWQEGDIITLGQDENSRPILTANFRIHRTPTS